MNTLRLVRPPSLNRCKLFGTDSAHAASCRLAKEPFAAPTNGRLAFRKRVRNIVVPLDETNFAERAIPLALDIAEAVGAVVHLVHVFVRVDEFDPYDALYFPDASIASLKSRKREYLAETISRLSGTSSAFVSGRLIDGRSVPEALNSLSGVSPDLIVMATHGRTALGRLWWGSVAHSLSRISKVPLILVRGSNERPGF